MTEVFRTKSSAATLLDKHIGAVLRAERVKQKYTPYEFAKRVGVAASTVYYMESGETGTRISTLVRWCAALRIRLSDVVFEAERRIEAAKRRT